MSTHRSGTSFSTHHEGYLSAALRGTCRFGHTASGKLLTGGAGTVPLSDDEQALERQRREEARASDWLMQSEGLGDEAFGEDTLGDA